MLNMRVKLIITTNDSSSGCLKAARMADRVVNITLENLCVGPVPPARDPATWLADRAALAADPDSDWAMPYAADMWLQADAACRLYDRIEIWPEPDSNAQLHLLCLLDRLTRSPSIVDKLFINHFESRIGEHRPEEIRERKHLIERVQPETLALASAAWTAFRHPTPEAWFGLLDRDLAALPYLEKTVLRLLAELPAADTGLAASERTILEMIAEGPIPVLDVLKAAPKLYPDFILHYWDLGWTLDRLAGGAQPLIAGLEGGPFTSDNHDDRARHKLYIGSQLTLTPLGRAALAGRAPVEIDRWWGGTHLVSDSPWRWDETNRTLLAIPDQPS